MDAPDQIAVLIAVLDGAFDQVELEQIDQAEKVVIQLIEKDVSFRIGVANSEKIDPQWRDDFLKELKKRLKEELQAPS